MNRFKMIRPIRPKLESGFVCGKLLIKVSDLDQEIIITKFRLLYSQI